MELYRHKDHNGSLTITLEQEKDGSIKLFYHDIGGQARRTFGDDDYEAWITISASEVTKLALALLREKLAGSATALSDLQNLCKEQGVITSAGSF